jgi:tetratricopeptide (TPR) repeat protein
MIFTFYSYKGGVGRSMALANVAACFQQAGLRVVIIDWDLEAPGIESYFLADPAELEEVRSSIGLMDALNSYRRRFASLEFPAHAKSASDRERVEADAIALESQLPTLRHALYPLQGSGDSSLSLLHAGWRAGERFKSYAESVQSFDWTQFYAAYRGEAYFEWMRRQLLSSDVADVVFIDSRTGVTEMGGVCTRQLADVVVCFSVMNRQNLQGTSDMAESFARTDLMERRGRPLQCVFVPARVDNFNTALKNGLQKEFEDRFSQYTPKALRNVKAQFWDLRIPYISDYAYRERLAVGDPQADKDLEESYHKVAAHLAMCTPRSSKTRALYASELKRIFGRQLPDVVVLYPDGAHAETALELVREVQRAEISVWSEPLEVATGATTDLHSAIAGARVVIAPHDAETTSSGWLRSVWWATRERGLELIPVQSGASSDESPAQGGWMRHCPPFALPRQWSDLIQRLREPRVMLRLLAMAPSLTAQHIIQRQEGERLVSALRQGAGAPAPITLVLWGLAGSGKTTLAAAVCQDERVQDAYPDGVMWVTLGEGNDVASELRRCLVACGRTPPPGTPESELRRELELQLKSRQCVIVIDELHDIADGEKFMLGGPGSAHIVTTRFGGLAYAMDATPIVIGELSTEEAHTLLTRRIAPGDDGVMKTAATLVDSLITRVGGSALAVNLINRELQRRTNQGQPFTEALSALAEGIDRVGLSAFEHRASGSSTDSIRTSIGSSFERLSAADKQRLLQLVESDSSARTSLSTLAARLQESPEELRDWVRQMADLALLQFDHTMETVWLHPLVQLFLASPASSGPPARSAEEGPASAPPREVVSAPPASGVQLPAAAAPEWFSAAGAAPPGGVSVSVSAREDAAVSPVSVTPHRVPSPAPARSRYGWQSIALVASLGVFLGGVAVISLSRSVESPPPPTVAAAPAPQKPAWAVGADPAPALPSPALAVEPAVAQLADQLARLADQTRANGDYRSALEQYTRATKLNPAAPRPWFDRANTELALGNEDAAIQSFRQALRSLPDDPPAPAATHEDAAERELRALAHLGLATAIGQRSSASGAVELDLEAGDGQLAMVELEQALALEPRSATIQLGLGGLLELAKRRTEAVDAYTRAIELDPELAEVYFRRGRLHQELAAANAKADTKDRRLAVADFRKVLAMASAEPRTAQAARARLEQLGERGEKPPAATTIYVQYGARSDAALVRQMAERLKQKGFVVPTPELVSGVQGAGSLRFFFADDDDDARLVKAAAESALASEGIDLSLVIQRGSIERFPSAKPRHLEVWLPSLAAPARMLFTDDFTRGR